MKGSWTFPGSTLGYLFQIDPAPIHPVWAKDHKILLF